MKKLILILLFIPLISLGQREKIKSVQDTISATKILSQKEAYMNKMMEIKKEFQINPQYKLSLSQESEWEDFFISESKRTLEIKELIDKTDKEIDTMVYQLYNLTSEEIEIIESSI
tara:strand:+ start:705 stop:1052 length:348 start_codon:yes stop_codon:yes gene_type:complete